MELRRDINENIIEKELETNCTEFPPRIYYYGLVENLK